MVRIILNVIDNKLRACARENDARHRYLCMCKLKDERRKGERRHKRHT